MENPLILGSTIAEFSSYGTIIRVDLSQWGGPPESRMTMRCADHTIWIVVAILREPTSESAASAVRKLMERMAELGFKHAWYGLAFPRPDVEANLANAGFVRGPNNFRMEKAVAATADPATSGFHLTPLRMDEDHSEFDGYFEATRRKTGFCDWSMTPKHVGDIFRHEMLTPNWSPAYRWISRGSQRVGITPVVTGMGTSGKNTGIITPFFRSQTWESGEAGEVMNFLEASLAHHEKAEMISTGCGEEDERYLKFLTDRGYAKGSEFPILYSKLK